MRRHEVENWALSVIDRVRSGQPVEDSRVELKAKWPESVKKAARRIAGHANAAHGEPILWLIGADEATGEILGAASEEFAGWYSGVRAEFDELAPEPVSLNIPVNGVTVTALYFETDGVPFVVKNAQGGTVQREVPWREATGVKSATRAQLLRLLSPLQKLPLIETVAYLVTISAWRAEKGQEFLNWDVKLALFLTQSATEETVFASHRSEISYAASGQEPRVIAGGVKFYGAGAKNINATDTFVSIPGSGLFEARTNHSFPMANASETLRDNNAFVHGIGIHLKLYAVSAERSISIAVDVDEQTRQEDGTRVWRKGFYSFSTYPVR